MAVGIQIPDGTCILVDEEDADRVRSLSLHRYGSATGDRYYAGVWIKGRHWLLHRWLVDAPDGVMVDHRDGVTTNNQKSNLRFATFGQNSANQKLSKVNTSGLKGVHKRGSRWGAQIVYGNEAHFLGIFDTAHEAGHAYNAAAIALFGEFARINYDDPSYRAALIAGVPDWYAARRIWLMRPDKRGRKRARPLLEQGVGNDAAGQIVEAHERARQEQAAARAKSRVLESFFAEMQARLREKGRQDILDQYRRTREAMRQGSADQAQAGPHCPAAAA